MIPFAKSVQFVRQIRGTHNYPIEAICRVDSGVDVFYLKYSRTSFELAGLVSEIVCHLLARELELKTPDISYVEIDDHRIPSDFDYIHCFNPGSVVFGSKKIYENASDLNKLEFIFSKNEFNKLAEPLDIFRIGIYDLWIGNKDRSHNNYNLLLTREKKQNIIVFDHFDAFDNITSKSIEGIDLSIDVYSNSFLISTYASKMLGWFSKQTLKTELDRFLNKINEINKKELLNLVVDSLPNSWYVEDKTFAYIEQFINSEDRLYSIEDQVNNYITYYLDTKP